MVAIAAAAALMTSAFPYELANDVGVFVLSVVIFDIFLRDTDAVDEQLMDFGF